ncbi:urease accessory protein UreF [Cognatishimia activa]|uniref:Urease accessory protein UreF n=1 Tax=Cognatishimia activa TaxID=1715691 RepID=A0A0P1ISS2_9RHOB|nr:urease accessory protein UreF [Cognatishimia activa]MEE2944657.1 urease accessory protein UreF [Pseudomonadota bacterium]CUI74106.1 Urease accessory protein UreF [Cognatishimia activa]CUK26668.1 Urease accessory protein UreF [Cognatishimia activa]
MIMTTDIPTITAMPIDPKLLTLTQWLSPSFPVGAFAYSHGLEQAVRSDWVKDGGSLAAWLEDVALYGSGHSDAIWIRLAYACEDVAAVEALNFKCRAYAPAFERQREAERQGRAFAKVASEVWTLTLPDLQFPVALGFAARQEDLDIEAVITLYLQGFLGNLVAAAQRLMPLGQTDAQGILAKLNPVCLDIAAQTQGKQLDDISSTAFLSDIAAMRHETLQPRIFQS